MTLAISDILYSISIHPMLISVSFGTDPHQLFGKTGGYKKVQSIKFSKYDKKRIACDFAMIQIRNFVASKESKSTIANYLQY